MLNKGNKLKKKILKKKTEVKKIATKKIDLVIKSQFAREMGISPASVTRLIKLGKIKTVKFRGKELINLRTQGSVYRKIAQTNKPPEEIPEDDDSLEVEVGKGNPRGTIKNIADARFQLEKFKAKKMKEEYLALSGSLIPIKEVTKEWADVATALKKSIMSLPARIGPLLAGESDPHATKQLLKVELTKCLQDTVDKYKPEQKLSLTKEEPENA